MTFHWIYIIIFSGSEDELSNGSGRSPRSSRHKHLGSLSSGNSRNQSPRSHNDAKLRPGITPRSSNRNSANLSTNNLQEELMRLINPDETCDPQPPPGLMECQDGQPEVILTMARPATVISNTSSTSSPLPGEFKSSDRSIKSSVGRNDVLPLPEEDMDWSSLVDTATRAMRQVSDDNISNDSIEAANHWDGDGGKDGSNSKICR